MRALVGPSGGAFLRSSWFKSVLLHHRTVRAMSSGRAASVDGPASPPCGTSSKPKVLVLTGPTAVGKTKISLALAERLNGEIISADSVQVYRDLDIGSDKITAEERRGIPHHLLDILSPEDDFSAGEFYVLARRATEDVLARGRTPIVVGGTGFYLRWYALGKPSTPAASRESGAAATERLEAAYVAAEAAAGRPLSDAERWAAGVRVVEQLGDAESAARLRGEPNNLYRLSRVVDILLQSPGKTLGQLDLDEARPLDYDFRAFFLNRPRAELYRRIDARVEEMVGRGLLAEAGRALAGRGLGPNVNCATRAIGYRQALEYLQRCEGGGAEAETALSEAGLTQFVRDVQSASRRLCHRQVSWFRDDPLFRWVDATQGEAAAVEEIVGLWEQEAHQGGHGGQSVALSKEQQLEMKRYVARLERYTPGSQAVAAALEEASRVVSSMRSDGALQRHH